ncbi:arabinogalactan endo-beta-1,4-galactanase [Microbacterium sp.]|uniref:glycoside hydrolase family 53 protein n=1 Tax=Microbacterium sp. TaxID=51671 RepID=UPI0039E4DC9E
MTLQIRGADVSMTAEVESLGGRYEGGRDLFEVLAEHGVNLARLRVWVDPYSEAGEPYLGGTNDLDTTLSLARRARAAGLDLMIDLHYSDFWCDPKKQSLPKAWRGLSFEQVADAVAAHTAQVLATVREELGAAEWVQIGNETTNGMLWPHGQTPKYDLESRSFASASDAQWRASFDALGRLLQSGADAARAASADSRLILHLDAGGADDLYERWFGEIMDRNVDFDAVGLSYYPLWHGSFDDLATNMAKVTRACGKDAIVVETAYAHRPDNPGATSMFDAEAARRFGYDASVEGQAAFLTELGRVIAQVPDGRGLGAVYWEPAWLPVDGTTWASRAGMEYGDDIAEPGNGWANQGLFDFEGRALASLDALGRM